LPEKSSPLAGKVFAPCRKSLRPLPEKSSPLKPGKPHKSRVFEPLNQK